LAPSVRSAITGMSRSGIRQVMDLAWATPNAIHLEVGEPNFPTPSHICEAATRAIQDGQTRYTPNAGIAPLREALAAKVKRVNKINATSEQIVVSAGAVQAIYASLLSVLNPGDEILLPDPGWPNFRMMAALLNAKVTYYPLRAKNGFLPDPAEIEELITPRTKAILLNSPSNPLGTVLSEKVSRQIYEIASKANLWIVSDECYDEITFDKEMFSFGTIDADERVISTYSFSKTYAMTGWRVGYAVAPLTIASELSKIQEPLISCVSSPAQFAALAALQGPQDCVAEMRSAYKSRRDAAIEIATAEGLRWVQPEGAFYLWMSCAEAGETSLDFVLELIKEEGVAIANGSAFGEQGEEWVRVSLANSVENISTGVRAVAKKIKS
jgi:aspartate aminotransferase